MKKTLNLLPPLAAAPFAKRNIIAAIAVGVVAYAAVLVGVWFLGTYELARVDNTIEDLQSRKLQVQKYMAASPSPGGISQGADPAIMSMMRTTPPWDAVLAELSLLVPDSVWLELIESADAKHLRLKGYANSQAGIANLIDNLERSQYFGNVEIIFAQKGTTAVTFELRTSMVWT